MHPAVTGLLASLSFGSLDGDRPREETETGTVSRLAQVYEVARNALEYRADHLVRRAAIERILRRQLVFGAPVSQLAEQLLTELRWALYVTEVDEDKVSPKELEHILNRFIEVINAGRINRDWLVGLISAEIEDRLNPNNDYHKFTNFAYHAIKNRVSVTDMSNLDLLLYVAVDRVYSQSDDQQVSYHLYQLIKGQAKAADEESILSETWQHYQSAAGSPVLNRLMAYVRRQMGPLVLIRDMYFSAPSQFATVATIKGRFFQEAATVLAAQLQLLKGRIRTATIRSLIYVFLTKMLILFVLEVPIERIIIGKVDYLTMGLNVVLPVAVMWLLVASVKLPGSTEQEKLLARAWELVSDFAARANESEMLASLSERSRLRLAVNYLFFALLFVAIFALIIWGLTFVKYNPASIAVFLFFLSVVSFFAYRIRQTAQVYLYRPRRGARAGLGEALMLPIIVVGGWLSSGVARLNFLTFIFDFVLEAPFKLILRFLDNLMAFLGARKDEAVG